MTKRNRRTLSGHPAWRHEGGEDVLNAQQRYSRLRPNMEKSFHIPLMVRIASASYWRELTKTERRLLGATGA